LGRPIAHLAGFRGTLQVDGYGAYKVLAARGAVHLAFCWSHVRRPFYELAQSGPAPIASEALARIAALYRIEADMGGRSADERRAVRQERSRPLVEALQPWLREKLSLISQKTKLAEAIRYALSRWAGLCLFLEDGRVEIDTDDAEKRNSSTPCLRSTQRADRMEANRPVRWTGQGRSRAAARGRLAVALRRPSHRSTAEGCWRQAATIRS